MSFLHLYLDFDNKKHHRNSLFSRKKWCRGAIFCCEKTRSEPGKLRKTELQNQYFALVLSFLRIGTFPAKVMLFSVIYWAQSDHFFRKKHDFHVVFSSLFGHAVDNEHIWLSIRCYQMLYFIILLFTGRQYQLCYWSIQIYVLWFSLWLSDSADDNFSNRSYNFPNRMFVTMCACLISASVLEHLTIIFLQGVRTWILHLSTHLLSQQES